MRKPAKPPRKRNGGRMLGPRRRRVANYFSDRT